jgi:hypothetical protein
MDSPIPFIAQTGVVFQRSVIDAQPLSREAGSDALTTRALWILRAPNPYYGSPGMCHEPTPYRPMMSDEYAPLGDSSDGQRSAQWRQIERRS